MAASHRSPYVVPFGPVDVELGVGKSHEFAELTIRQGFVRKVFGKLFITTRGVAFAAFSKRPYFLKVSLPSSWLLLWQSEHVF